MRSSQLDLKNYQTEKASTPHFFEHYDPILEPWVNKPINLLELGVREGVSMFLWRDYFPSGNIFGIDIELPKDFEPADRIQLFQGNQADRQFLSSVSNKVAPDGFDIIIDDASHIGELTSISFWHLFDNHLKPGGLYVIEDWGTGYWDEWPDGRCLDLEDYVNWRSKALPLWAKIANKIGLKPQTISAKTPAPCHSNGMVGFVKQLVDEQAAADVTRKKNKTPPLRQSKFESLLITPHIVFVRKSST